MKSTIQLALILLFSFSFAITSYCVNTPASLTYDLSTMSVDDYVGMSYKNFKEISPKKLNVIDRIGFIATKKYYKSEINKKNLDPASEYSVAADGFKFKFGPFFIGLILGLIGTLIIVLVVPKPRKNAVISSLIGAVIAGAIIGGLI